MQHCLDEQDVQAQILRHRNEENMPNVPDPVYSSNSEEGEYVCSLLAEYVLTYLTPTKTYMVEDILLFVGK